MIPTGFITFYCLSAPVSSAGQVGISPPFPWRRTRTSPTNCTNPTLRGRDSRWSIFSAASRSALIESPKRLSKFANLQQRCTRTTTVFSNGKVGCRVARRYRDRSDNCASVPTVPMDTSPFGLGKNVHQELRMHGSGTTSPHSAASTEWTFCSCGSSGDIPGTACWTKAFSH